VKRLPIHTLLVTNLISSFGNTLTSLAVPWFVLETTGSAGRTGLTAAVTTVPVIFASLFGGALVDRMNRKWLSIFADAMSAVTLAAVPFLHATAGLTFPVLLILMFLGAIFDSPGGTARQAMVPLLAQRGEMPLERVNSFFGINQAVSSLAGAPIAGVMIAWLGAADVLWFAAGAFVVSIIGMLVLVPSAGKPAPSGENYLAEMKAGLRFVTRDTLLRTVVPVAIVINFIFSPVFGVAMPFYARKQFGSAQDLGIMMSGIGVGMLIGAFSYGWLALRFGPRKLIIGCVFFLGAPIAGLAFLPSLWIAWALLLLTGCASGMVNPLLQTMLQKRTPQELMGRVIGTLSAGSIVAAPAGLLIGGSVISLIGLPSTLLAASAVIVAMFVYCFFNRALREIDSESPSTAPAAGGTSTTAIFPVAPD
jgi:MFS family permease